jgi:arsenate reductase
MAEALLRNGYGALYDAYSAGTRPTEVNPFAIRAIAELGVDMSAHRAKGVEELSDIPFDLVITVCDDAAETCPVVPGQRHREHKSFPDPTSFRGSEEETIAFFRKVRDEIAGWIEDRFGSAPAR